MVGKTTPLLLAIALAMLSPRALMSQEADEDFSRSLEAGRRAFDVLDVATAVRRLEAAVAAAEKAEVPPLDLAEAHRMLGLCREIERDPAAAEVEHRAVLALTEKARGATHPELVGPLETLARLLRQRGAMEEAAQRLDRALKIAEAAETPDPETLLRLLDGSARCWRQAGRLERAAAALERQVALTASLRGAEHPDVAAPLKQLGRVWSALRRPAEALACERRWIAIYEAVRGPDTPTIATGLDRVSALLLQLGRPAEAEPVVERWLKVLARVSADHPERPGALGRGAEVAAALGRRDLAVERARAAHDEARRLFAGNTVRTARLELALARRLREAGLHEEAAERAAEARAVFEKRLRSVDPEIQQARMEEGRAHAAGGRLEAAEACFRTALRALSGVAGPEHPVLAEPLRELASVLERRGEKEEAASLRSRAEAIERPKSEGEREGASEPDGSDAPSGPPRSGGSARVGTDQLLTSFSGGPRSSLGFLGVRSERR